MLKAWRSFTVSFGLINIPVAIAPLVGSTKVSGNLVCARHKERLTQQYLCPTCGDKAEKATGYSVGDRYVLLGDGYAKGLETLSNKVLKLDAFVPVKEVDPLYFDKSYIAWPKTENRISPGAPGFALMAKTLAGTGLMGVGSTVLDKSERPMALRWSDKAQTLLIQTLHYQEAIKWSAVEASRKFWEDQSVPKDQVKMAGTLIQQLTGSFDPDRYVDGYSLALREMIEQAAQGLEPQVTVTATEEESVPDILTALKAMAEEQNKKEAKSGKKAVKQTS